MIIPYPVNIPWDLWSGTVIGFNPELSNQVSPFLNWRDFGDRLTLLIPQAPRTSQFEDWRDWATMLANVANN